MEKNKFNNVTKIFEGDNEGSSFKMGLNYNSDEKEFVVFLITPSNEIKYIIFTQNYKVKGINSNNEKCYSSFSISNGCDNMKTPNLIYDKNIGNYIVLRLCGNDNNLVELSDYEQCNEIIEFDGLDFDDIEPTTKTTIPTTLITTIFKTSLIKTTIPTTLINKESTLIRTSLIKTTIPTTLMSTTTVKKSQH